MAAVVKSPMDASADAVFDVLSDGWLYAAWVVGASRVRDVDPGWPKEGTRIHHSVGLWPAVVDDRTKVVAVDAPRHLELDVALWFLGRGRVFFDLEPDGPDRCTVTMREYMESGVMAHLPDAIVDPLLKARNVETLRRLEALARRPR
jgi:hypothetical protein